MGEVKGEVGRGGVITNTRIVIGKMLRFDLYLLLSAALLLLIIIPAGLSNNPDTESTYCKPPEGYEGFNEISPLSRASSSWLSLLHCGVCYSETTEYFMSLKYSFQPHM